MSTRLGVMSDRRYHISEERVTNHIYRSNSNPDSSHPLFPSPAMSNFAPSPVDATSIATIRTLAADVVAKANSGHPGAPMGLAPVCQVLFTRFFHANPKSSKWFNRDRFVLSNGHACALQYIVLHLAGYKLSLDDLKSFRQIDSLTPGHPEANHTDGIEVTTGPLGQGISNAVGLAIAQAHLGAVYNRDGFDLLNNYTYAILGDGCLMEGISSEACSLAGHLQLGNLIAIWDDNHITIDGNTAVAFTENVEQRYLAYGWQVLHVKDGDHDLEGIYNAIAEARREKSKPTLIRLTTTIGYGSKQQGTHGVHGSPLKAEDIAAIKTKVPKEVYDCWSEIGKRGVVLEKQWHSLLDSYAKTYPNEHAELTRRISGKLPDGWEKTLPVYKSTDPAQASRKLNLTRVKGVTDFQPENTGLGSYKGTYIRYGVREHGMGAIANGISAYGVSFLRLSALTGHQVIWVATHDSIGLGEDGPTHQPVETAIHFRATPNLAFWRPADGNETSAAYQVAMRSNRTPSILSLSRQNLPNLENSTIEHAAKGGYVVHEEQGEQLTIVATGSEVSIALEAAGKLRSQGIKTRVVSLPAGLYLISSRRNTGLAFCVVARRSCRSRRFGKRGRSHEQYGLPAWGASGPYKKVYEKFGITGDNIAVVGKKVVDFYKAKGGEVVSPLVKAL
ncbi:transketolase [Lactarius quietus]|nr:transketolase [Lactarius quietus]